MTVFISYARESDAHSQWVRRLADAIEELPEFHVVFDQYDLHPGRDLTAFMDLGLACSRIIAVITPEYVRKAEQRLGGVGYESSVISADLLSHQLSDRFVPVLRAGSERPAFLRSKVYVDLRAADAFMEGIEELRAALLGLTPAERPAKRKGSIQARGSTGRRGQMLSVISPPAEPENEAYTFDSFIPDGSSRGVYAMCISVAEKPGENYNPLFVYGPPGSGKTHLLHAIASKVRSHHPNLIVARLTTERFVTSLIAAIRSDRMTEFRQWLSTVDVLLLDDFSFVIGKDRSEEELGHRLEELLAHGVQVVVTSDRALHDMGELDGRLRGRFEAGLIAELTYPEMDTRVQILHRLASDRRLALTDEIYALIAERIAGSPRKLQSAISRIAAEIELSGTSGGADDVRRIIDKLIPMGSRLPPNKVVEAVARHYGLSKSDLLSHSNARVISFPRQVAFYLLKQCTDLSYPEIGRLFNNKHHSTVMYGVQQIVNEAATDTTLAATLRQLEDTIR